MNHDVAEMSRPLATVRVEFLVVSGYAVAGHGVTGATGDIELWSRPTETNTLRPWKALEAFGAPRRRLSPDSFTEPDVVHQIGLPPSRIDFLTTIDGVEFDAAWPEPMRCIVGDVEFPMLSLRHLFSSISWRPSERLGGRRILPMWPGSFQGR